MSKLFYFVDEAGNFDFRDRGGASKHFILTSVAMEDCTVADSLVSLRREFEWNATHFGDGNFHCTTDKQAVRDEVFSLIAGMDIRIDATIFEKRKTVPHRQKPHEFYKLAWYNHARHTLGAATNGYTDLHVIAASLGTRKDTKIAISSIRDVVDQCGRDQNNTRVSIVPYIADPGLIVADYCCWAIQRKWEKGDDRSWQIIQHLVKSEYDYFQMGRTYYY